MEVVIQSWNKQENTIGFFIGNDSYYWTVLESDFLSYLNDKQKLDYQNGCYRFDLSKDVTDNLIVLCC